MYVIVWVTILCVKGVWYYIQEKHVAENATHYVGEHSLKTHCIRWNTEETLKKILNYLFSRYPLKAF